MRTFSKRIIFAFILIVLLLSIGTVYYSHAEGWSYVDSFYFSTMTLTTIGFGDLTPTGEASKIFTSLYAIFGIGIMLYILSSVVGVVVFRQEGRVSRAFSFIRRMRKQEREIKSLRREVKPSIKEFEKQKKKITRLEEKVRPSIKRVRKQEKEIKKLERKIKGK
jgi:peptidoglycan hydrolase CwlO-like protein